VIALIAISCYDVTSAYIPFTYSAKVSWEIKLSPSAARLPPAAATADSLVHVIWYTRLPPVICALMLGAHLGGRLIIAVTFQLDSASLAWHSALTLQLDSN